MTIGTEEEDDSSSEDEEEESAFDRKLRFLAQSEELGSKSVPVAPVGPPLNLIPLSDMKDETKLSQRMTALLTADFLSCHRYTEEIDTAIHEASPALMAEPTLNSSWFTLTC